MQFPQPIVNQLTIFGSDNLPDVTIGTGPNIRFYDGTSLIVEITATPTPRILVQDTVGDELRLFVSGVPVIQFEIASFGIASETSIAMGTSGSQAYFRLFFVGNISSSFVQLCLVEDATGAGFVQVNKAILATDPALPGNPTDIETWHAVTYQNGWTNIGGAFGTVAYRLMPDGTTLLRGVSLWDGVAGHKVDGTVIFNLPAAYRPTSAVQIPVSTDVAGVTPNLQILTNGNVTITKLGAGNIIAFDGVRLPTL